MEAIIQSVNLEELPRTLKLILDISFIDDDWIADNIEIREVEELVKYTFNNDLKNNIFYRYLKSIKKHKLHNCFIFNEDHTVYLLPRWFFTS